MTGAAPPLPPPAIVQPAPREVSFGAVAGWAPAGTKRIVVRVDGRVAADRKLAGRHFSLRLALPARDAAVTVTAHADGWRRSSATVTEVYGLPAAARPTGAVAHEDAALARTVRRLAAGFHGTSGVYVEDLRTGSGAAWNARARFPAGSTLKLAIAVTVLARLEGRPAPGSRVDSLMNSMLTVSDNEAANALETWLADLKDDRARAKILARIDRLALGNPGDVAPVGEGVSEMRVHYGPGYRLYFVQRGQQIIFLLTGGDKSSQTRDIKAAIQMSKEL